MNKLLLTSISLFLVNFAFAQTTNLSSLVETIPSNYWVVQTNKKIKTLKINDLSIKDKELRAMILKGNNTKEKICIGENLVDDFFEQTKQDCENAQLSINNNDTYPIHIQSACNMNLSIKLKQINNKTYHGLYSGNLNHPAFNLIVNGNISFTKTTESCNNTEIKLKEPN